jgi:hypothetical protein
MLKNIMMKKLQAALYILLLSSVTTLLYSQSNVPIRLGLKIAPNMGWMSPGTKGYSNDGPKFGMTVGFVSDIYFAENYAFSTGFNFQFINGKLFYNDSLSINGNKKLVYGEVFRKYNFLYLEIPVTIKMQTKVFGKVSYFGQIGLGTGFRVNAKAKDHIVLANGETIDQQEDISDETTLIRESLLVGIGCSYHLDEQSRIFVGLLYSNALNNILTGSNSSSNLIEKGILNYAEINIGILF